MHKPWNRHITGNDISRYLAAEKQRWIDRREYLMHPVFMKSINRPECIQPDPYLDLMTTHYLNQMRNCMVFPPTKLLSSCRGPYPFPPSRRSMNYGILSNRHNPRAPNTRPIRNEELTNVRSWRRGPGIEHPQNFREELDSNMPSSTVLRTNKDTPPTRSVEKTKGRKLRSTNWSSKESQSNDIIAKEQSHNKGTCNRSIRERKSDTKHRPHGYGIHDDHEPNLRERLRQWSPPPSHDEEKNSRTKFTVASSSSGETTVKNRKSSSPQLKSDASSTFVNDTSMNYIKKTNATSSWAAQMEEENNLIEVPNTTDSWNWFCKEEQQRIVDMLKIEDLNHERQLMQDFPLSENSNQGKGDSLGIPIVYNIKFPHEDYTETLEESLSSSEDDITVIIPVDAFAKSLQVFSDQQPDFGAISDPVQFPESTEDAIHESARKISIDANTNNIPDAMNYEDWGKYCVGWSVDVANQKDQPLKVRSESETICSHSPASNEIRLHEFLTQPGTKAEDELLSICFDASKESATNSDAYLPEFYSYNFDAFSNLSTEDIQTPKSSTVNLEHVDSLSFPLEQDNEINRSFEITELSDCQKLNQQMLTGQNFDDMRVNNIEDDSMNNQLDKEIINDFYGSSDGNIRMNQSSIKPHLNSREPYENLYPSCRRFPHCSSPIFNCNCCSRYAYVYPDGKNYPSYAGAYQNGVSRTTSSSVYNDHDIRASNFLKLILGISTNIEEAENNKDINSLATNARHSDSATINYESSIPTCHSPAHFESPAKRCNYNFAPFSPKASENTRINQIPLTPIASPRCEYLNYNVSFKDKTPKVLSKSHKNSSFKIKSETEMRFEDVTCSDTIIQKNIITCQNGNQFHSLVSESYSEFNEDIKSLSLEKSKVKKTKKSYNERKRERHQLKPLSAKPCSTTDSLIETNTSQKKTSDAEHLTRIDESPFELNKDISGNDSGMKAIKISKIMDEAQGPFTPIKNVKCTRNLKSKTIKISNIFDKKQQENKNKTIDQPNINKLKTNAEIAAEYQARRKAKLYHEKKTSAIDLKNKMHGKNTGSFLILDDTNVSTKTRICEQVETVTKRSTKTEPEKMTQIKDTDGFSKVSDTKASEKKQTQTFTKQNTKREAEKNMQSKGTGSFSKLNDTKVFEKKQIKTVTKQSIKTQPEKMTRKKNAGSFLKRSDTKVLETEQVETATRQNIDMELKKAMQNKDIDRVSKLRDTKMSMKEQVEKVKNWNTKISISENVSNKHIKKQSDKSKVHNAVTICLTRALENGNTNVACTSSQNIVNFHENVDFAPVAHNIAEEVIYLRKREESIRFQKISQNASIADNVFKKSGFRDFNALTETKSSVLPYEAQQPYVVRNFVIPRTIDNNTNLLSQKLMYNLLKVSYSFNPSISNTRYCIVPKYLQPHQMIRLNPTFEEGTFEHLEDHSRDFYLKLYDYLYHLWRRQYHSPRTVSFCEHQFGKRALFSIWLRHKFFEKDLKPNER